MTELSVCIAAYNQRELIRHNLDILTKYPHDNIEVVISDDCSTEDLGTLVQSYNDARFRHVRTPHNLGHDGNILYGIRQCKSDYVMLMRSRDSVIPEAIPSILTCIRNNPNAGYYLFSAYDETGRPRLKLKNRIYEIGPQTVWAQSNLLIHPSGGIYNKRYLRLDLYTAYCTAYFEHKYGFVAHQLMRADESTHAPFVTSPTFGWVYANTLESTDVAVNSTSNRTNVYAPDFVRPRYACEFDFARFEMSDAFKSAHLAGVVQRYLQFFLYHLPIILSSEKYARHYRSTTSDYDLLCEMNTARRLTSLLSGGLDEESLRAINRVERVEYAKAYTLYPAIHTARRAILSCEPLSAVCRKALAALR